MKNFKKYAVALIFPLVMGCGLQATDVLQTPVVPDNCKDAYVYKLNLYPNVTSAIEAGSIAVLMSVKDSADPMMLVCQKAIEEVQLGSAQLAFADLAIFFSKNSKYAVAGAFAVSQIQDRLKDVVLTQCDKDTLTSMFKRIIGYAQAAKVDSKK